MTLSEAGAEGLETTDEPLTVNAKLALRAEVLAPEKFRINPSDIFGPALPGRWRRDRRSPAILEAPAWYETVATIDLPVGYDVLADPVAKLVTPFAEYASGFALRERTLNFSRRLVIKQHIITAEQWPAFRELLDQIEEIERNGIPVFLTEEVEEPAP